MKLGEKRPWWVDVYHVCDLCGGGFTLDTDDHPTLSTKTTDREFGQTGSLGTRWSGVIQCPYCKQGQRVTTFTK